MTFTVQIVLFDGFDPLDAIAPFEVWDAGADAAGADIHLSFVSADGARLVTSGTREMPVAATGMLDPTLPGIIIVPGASGPVDGDPDEVNTVPVLLGRFAQSSAMPLIEQALANPSVLVACVCGGSLALAMAGLLEARNAVTHVLGLDVLEATGVEVVRARVVDDGDLVTSGGVTSGLDLALYLLERKFGPSISLAVEKLFEYERRGTVWRSAVAS